MSISAQDIQHLESIALNNKRYTARFEQVISEDFQYAVRGYNRSFMTGKRISHESFPVKGTRKYTLVTTVELTAQEVREIKELAEQHRMIKSYESLDSDAIKLRVVEGQLVIDLNSGIHPPTQFIIRF